MEDMLCPLLKVNLSILVDQWLPDLANKNIECPFKLEFWMSHVKFGTLCIAYLKFKFTWGIFYLETLSGPQDLSSRDFTPLITCHSHPLGSVLFALHLRANWVIVLLK